MASKLELVFSGTAVAGQNIVLKTGITFNFVNTRQGAYQVGVSSDLLTTVKNFRGAFNTDVNFLGDSTTSILSGETDYTLIIENPDNDFFNGFSESTTFTTATVTTTAAEVIPDVTATLAQANSNPCGNYGLVITPNVEGSVVIESPIGVQQYSNTVIADAPFQIDLARPSSSVESVVKLYNTTGDLLLLRLYTAPGVLSVTSVTLTGSPFGAVALINATAGDGRTYSLDGTNFQGSREFAGLLAGNYTAYVKDSLGCTKTKTFEVTDEYTQGLTVDPFIRIPVHNSLHFVDRTGNSLLNYLSTEMPGHVSIARYFQEYLVGDSITTQFKSSYPGNAVFLIDENGVETEVALIKKSTNINRVNIYEGNYTDKDGRLAIYFTSGNIYNSDGSIQELGHNLNGLLPDWYEEGMYVNIEGVGVTQIDRLLVDTDGTNYAITQMDAAGTVLSKKITSVHTAHPYEVYEFSLYFPTPGRFQVRVEYGDAGFYLSEIIRINEELPEEFLKIEWWNENNNDILYNTGITHFRRLEWENWFKLIPKSTKEVYDTDTTVELINSKSFSVYELALKEIPMELARGLMYGLDNSSTILVEGAVFVSETPIKFEDMGAWYLPVVELTLVDQTMNGQQEIVDVVNAEFLNLATPSNVSFLRLS